MNTPKILAVLKPQSAAQFHDAFAVLEQAVREQKIWNVEFVNAKDTLSRSMEAAIKVPYEPFLQKYHRGTRSSQTWDHNDPRHDISSYMNYISAPKLLRRLEKANFDCPVIREYMEYLREMVMVGALIKSVKPHIVKGRRPAENPKEVDLTNTGICAICENRQKLAAAGNMVHHGYKISNGGGHYFGTRIGSCFGVPFLPYELSCEANKQWKVYLDAELKKAKQYLVTLINSAMETLPTHRHEYKNHKRESITDIHPKGTPGYEREREIRIQHTQWDIRNLKNQIERQTEKIANWKLCPPVYGTKVVDQP